MKKTFGGNLESYTSQGLNNLVPTTTVGLAQRQTDLSNPPNFNTESSRNLTYVHALQQNPKNTYDNEVMNT